jgi:hypothetical protein
VRNAAKRLGKATRNELSAFREETYSVSGDGAVTAQSKFMPLPTALRLTVRVLQRLDQKFSVDFGQQGWESLRISIKIRNRITHPKSRSDLTVSNIDVQFANAGFNWLLALTIDGMNVANLAMVTFTQEAREMLAEHDSERVHAAQ